MRLALFEPEIAGNAGAALRIAACFGVALDVVEPCGFPLSDKALRRAALDYGERVETRLHADWNAYLAATRPEGRLLLLTTRGETPLWSHGFRPDDALLVGRESAGAPDFVHAAADVRLRIPLAPGARSLNMAVAAAVALAEARRQLGFGDASVAPTSGAR